VDPGEELRRLREGAPGDPAPGPLDSLAARCPGGGAEALARCREVLAAVLERSSGPWPSLEEWKGQLPAWFLERCSDDVEVRSCVLDRWSLRAWIYWFQPERRRWHWWGAEADGELLRIALLVVERPYLRGALDWLLRCAGAERVDAPG
jgi:hypothetical protein